MTLRLIGKPRTRARRWRSSTGSTTPPSGQRRAHIRGAADLNRVYRRRHRELHRGERSIGLALDAQATAVRDGRERRARRRGRTRTSRRSCGRRARASPMARDAAEAEDVECAARSHPRWRAGGTSSARISRCRGAIGAMARRVLRIATKYRVEIRCSGTSATATSTNISATGAIERWRVVGASARIAEAASGWAVAQASTASACSSSSWNSTSVPHARADAPHQGRHHPARHQNPAKSSPAAAPRV